MVHMYNTCTWRKSSTPGKNPCPLIEMRKFDKKTYRRYSYAFQFCFLLFHFFLVSVFSALSLSCVPQTARSQVLLLLYPSMEGFVCCVGDTILYTKRKNNFIADLNHVYPDPVRYSPGVHPRPILDALQPALHALLRSALHALLRSALARPPHGDPGQ